MPTEYVENGVTYTRYTAEEVKKLPSLTDWARVDAMTDEELTANALSDPDNPPLDDAFFEKAKRMRLEDFMPATKEKVCLRLDRDVVGWFRSRQKKAIKPPSTLRCEPSLLRKIFKAMKPEIPPKSHKKPQRREGCAGRD